MFSSNGGNFNVSSWRIKLTHYNETKNKAHDSHIVRAKENVSTIKLTDVFKTFVLFGVFFVAIYDRYYCKAIFCN